MSYGQEIFRIKYKETKELYSKNKSCKYLGEIMQLEYILEILNKGE